MSRSVDIAAALQAALAAAPPDHDDQNLVTLLAARGYSYPARSATNIRLLAAIFPPDILSTITTAALSTAMPDMALNNLERVTASISAPEMLVVCSAKNRLLQLLTICGASPFITGILSRDPVYFRQLFLDRQIDLKRDESSCLAALRSLISGQTDYNELFPILRRFKHQEILRIAARDLNGLASLEEVTAELSALAAATLQVAYEVVRRTLAAEHGTPLMTDGGDLREADLTILGMGKLGGRELNFSSDIDLIYFYSSDRGETTGVQNDSGEVKGKISLHSFFVKMGEMITRAISQVTEDGFVFRVDLGLRPEGKSGDIAISARSAEVYYESWGQSWERAAMLKARPVAGSLELGDRVLQAIDPFIYRRYLDYTLIESIMSMKMKIDASLAREMEGKYNIKLGPGGIREIEFFIQTLQLVYAGKNATLRKRNTLEALEALKTARLVNDDDNIALREAYRFLRTVEHRIQVVQERQTHSIPKKDDELKALARRCGFLRNNGVERFCKSLDSHRHAVSSIYGNLFLSRDQKLKEEVQPEIYFFLDRSADPDLIKDMLCERHFQRADAAYEHLLLLRDGPPKAHLTERARRLLEQIAPLLLQEIFSSPDPDMSLANTERFLCAIGTRSTFYALLAENREILKLLVSLFGMSEFLSKILIAHPELLDSMVARVSRTYIKEQDEMTSELQSLLEQATYFEERLDIIRRYRHEEFLRIGMNDIYGKMGQTEITTQLTRLADACLIAAHKMAGDELSRYGRPVYTHSTGVTRHANLAIVGLGKKGAFEINYHSDLDIIYIYDRQGITDGVKQITNHEYFAKLGQKIISILTTLTREGYVYKIDTRLRPSGNAGPLVTSLDSFKHYHDSEAQIWERQALTKARVVLGEEILADSIAEVVRHTVYGSSIDEAGREEIHRLRMRMENEIARESEGSYNIKTGRGGIVDVEFVVQYLQLRHGRNCPDVRKTNTLAALKAMKACGLLDEQEAGALLDGYKFLRRLENRLRIIHDYSMNALGGAEQYLNKLARRLGYDPKLKDPGKNLMQDYEVITGAVRGVYLRIVGGETPPPAP